MAKPSITTKAILARARANATKAGRDIEMAQTYLEDGAYRTAAMYCDSAARKLNDATALRLSVFEKMQGAK